MAFNYLGDLIINKFGSTYCVCFSFWLSNAKGEKYRSVQVGDRVTKFTIEFLHGKIFFCLHARKIPQMPRKLFKIIFLVILSLACKITLLPHTREYPEVSHVIQSPQSRSIKFFLPTEQYIVFNSQRKARIYIWSTVSISIGKIKSSTKYDKKLLILRNFLEGKY